MTKMGNQTVSLILGSGGARGLAHIGAIRAIEERGFKVESVAGCSMGALIGGIYAQGCLHDYVEWIRSINKVDMLRLLDISLKRGGLVKGDRLIAHLRELVGEQQIEDLSVPYTAVATDIDRQKEVWIDRGPLFDAIRASISLPFFFLPFQTGGSRLVDGGVTNPLPIAPTFRDSTDLSIAVNLSGPVDASISKRTMESENMIGKLRDKIPFSRPDFSKRDGGVYDVAMLSYEIMQETLTRQKLAVYPPDLVVNIPRNACSPMGYDEADRLIELGYERTQQALEALG